MSQPSTILLLKRAAWGHQCPSIMGHITDICKDILDDNGVHTYCSLKAEGPLNKHF